MAKLIIEVDAKDAKRALGQVKKGLKDVGSQAKVTVKNVDRVSKAGKSLASSLTMFLAPAMAAVFARKTITLAIEQAQAIAQIDAAVKSTGMSAGFTTKELEKMAAALQKQSIHGDEAILKMQALLLTFKSVKGDQFRDATQAIIDMTSRMGSLESNALLLGKALDDPARRASELSRSGIVLTQTQQDLIKALDATGQRAKAQGIILEEIATQFGGAGKAAADAAGGGIKQFQNALGDLMEEFGRGLVDELDKVARSMNNIAQSDDAAESVRALGIAAGGAIGALAALAALLKAIRELMFIGSEQLTTNVGGFLGDLIRDLDRAIPLVDELGRKFGFLIHTLGLNAEMVGKNAEKQKALRKEFGITMGLIPRLVKEFGRYTAEVEEGLSWTERMDEATAEMLVTAEAEEKALEEVAKATARAAEEIRAYHESIDLAILDQFVDRLEKIAESLTKPIEKFDELSVATRDFKLPTTDEIFGEGTEEWLRGQEEAAKKAEEIWISFSRSFQATFSDAIFDVLDGNLDNFDDFFDSVFDMFKKMIAEMITYALANKILLGIGFGESFGGLLGGLGGGAAGGGLLGAGAGSAFTAGLGGVSGGGLANAVGLGLQAAAPVLGIAVAAALLKANIDAQNKKKTTGTIGFGSGDSASGFSGTVLGDNQDELLATYHSIIDLFSELESLTGSAVDLTERMRLNIKGHGKVWTAILSEAGQLITEQQFDSLEAAMEFGIARLMSTAELDDASQAISELLKQTVQRGVEQTMADVSLLAGLDDQLAAIQGFATPANDQALQQIQSLQDSIIAMGLSAEAAAPFLERLAVAEEDRIRTLETDVLSRLFSYLEGSAKFEQQRMELAKQKIELEFGIIKAQLQAYNLWVDYANVWNAALAEALGNVQVGGVQEVAIVEDLTVDEDAAWQAEKARRKRRREELRDLIKVLRGDLGKKGGKTPFEMMLADLLEEMKKQNDDGKALIQEYIDLLKQQRGTEIEGILLNYVKDDERYTEQWRQWQEAKLRIEFELLKADLKAIGLWGDLADLWADALDGALDNLDDTIDNLNDTIDEFRNAIEALKDYRDSLLLSDLSPLPLRAQLDVAQGAFNDLLQDALAGDAGAIAALPNAAGDLLRIAQQLFGSGGNFKAIFDTVMSALDAVLQVEPPGDGDPDDNSKFIGVKIDQTTDAVDRVRGVGEDSRDILQMILDSQIRHATAQEKELMSMSRSLSDMNREAAMANAIN